LATDASSLYARNVYNFFELLFDKEAKELKIDWADEIIKGTCVTHEGSIVHPALAHAEKAKPAKKMDTVSKTETGEASPVKPVKKAKAPAKAKAKSSTKTTAKAKASSKKDTKPAPAKAEDKKEGGSA
jgi:NAD(P) transhydrogenase subunit alpha